jgi:hypothetical protein
MTSKSVTRAAGTIICLLILSPAAYADHTWGSSSDPADAYHWPRSANPIDLTVETNITSEWVDVTAASIDDWDASIVISLTEEPGSTSSRTRRQCKAVGGKIRVCNAAYGPTGWLGVATINIESDGHITKGTAKVNDTYANYWAIVGEMRHVMCQEIGHLFGLGHTSTDGSSQGTCMDYSMDLASQRPNPHDYDTLEAIYTHLDADGGGSDPTPCRGGPKKCGSGGPEIPPMGVRVHKGEHHEIWVARGNAGDYWIHHVRLVPEEYR